MFGFIVNIANSLFGTKPRRDVTQKAPSDSERYISAMQRNAALRAAQSRRPSVAPIPAYRPAALSRAMTQPDDGIDLLDVVVAATIIDSYSSPTYAEPSQPSYSGDGGSSGGGGASSSWDSGSSSSSDSSSSCDSGSSDCGSTSFD